jgi:hypothetical protein
LNKNNKICLKMLPASPGTSTATCRLPPGLVSRIPACIKIKKLIENARKY